MKALLELMEKGGPAMIAILALSVVLYSRCFKLLLALFRSRRRLQELGRGDQTPESRQELQEQMRESFDQQRIPLSAMIAAAPLLGLLGTVSGMTKTFDGLSAHAGQKSMEALARGISEVLVSTESGLVVALPALLLVYFGHREMLRHVERLNRPEPPA